MQGREKRRDRTIRYGERARKVHLRWNHRTGPVDCICEFSAWFFAKKKSLGCGCIRTRKGKPKLIVSMCHGGSGYHPSVVERIRGRRLAKAWLIGITGSDPDDLDL